MITGSTGGAENTYIMIVIIQNHSEIKLKSRIVCAKTRLVKWLGTLSHHLQLHLLLFRGGH